MDNRYYAYNNEAIAFYCLYWVVAYERTIDFSKYSLILPFLLNDSFVKAVEDLEETIPLTDFVIQHKINLAKFNNKYLNLLPVTINSSIMLRELGLIDWSDGKIEWKRPLEPCSYYSSGDRLCRIMSIRRRFVEMFKLSNTVELFNSLKILL